MAQTTLISSISRSTAYPVSVQATADNSCGTLSLIIPNAWSEQMLMELPTINISIFMEDGTKLKSFNINMTTVNNEIKNAQSADAYSIPIYDIPESFTFSIIPLFDKFALSAHNHNVENGNIEIFNTSSSGIVDTDIEDYSSKIWTTDTQTFNVKIVFDDSNISASGGSGGGGGGGSITVDTQVLPNSINPVQNRAIYDFVNSSVSTNTAYFIGTFNSVDDLEAYSGSVSNNDYAFVIGTDSDSNTIYNRYKYNGSTETWEFEYSLNNSSFTSAEWETIQSGLTAQDKTNYNNHLSNTNNPHFVTKSQIGLGNVDNTSDENKPISTAMQTALDAKSDKNATVSNIAYDTTNKKLTKTINGNTTDVVSASTLKTDMSLNNVGNFKAVSTVASQGLNDTEKSNARDNINAQENLSFDGTYNSSTNKVATQSTVSDSINALDVSSVGGAGKVISAISETNGKISATVTTMDTVPTENSTNPVTSGGVAESQAKQDAEIAWAVNTGCKNLLKNTNSAGSQEIRTLTFTTDSQGCVTISPGTAHGGNADLHINSNAESDLVVGQTYILTGCPSGGNLSGYRLNISSKGADTGEGLEFTYDGSQIDVYIRVSSGYQLANEVTFKPMIRPASITDSTFVPYALTNPTLTPAVIKAVDEGAKNLLPITIQTQTVKTVVFTVNSDGTITANGTVTGGDAYLNLETSIGDKYTGNILSGGASNLKICISKGGSGQIAVRSESSEGVEIPDNATNTIFLFATNGTQLNNVTVKPMICTAADWAVSQKFVPYCPTMQEMYQMILALQSETS